MPAWVLLIEASLVMSPLIPRPAKPPMSDAPTPTLVKVVVVSPLVLMRILPLMVDWLTMKRLPRSGPSISIAKLKASVPAVITPGLELKMLGFLTS